MLVDFHTHTLPGIDDGAHDVKTALAMLSELKKNGVGIVAATPHYFAHEQTVPDFLLKRKSSLDSLLSEHSGDTIKIVPAAEVYVERGIRHLDLRPLCYQNTDYLLVELPYTTYQTWYLEEVYNLCLKQSLTPVFAHLDRYTKKYSHESINEILDFDNSVIQINISALLDIKTRRFVMNLIKQRYPVIFASDCHGLRSNIKNIPKARSVLKFGLGDKWIEDYDRFSLSLIGENA